MTEQKELAALIRKGLESDNVKESENCFFEDVFGKFYVCALGAGLVGKFGSAEKAHSVMEMEMEVHVELGNKDLTLVPDYVDIAANLLEIDFDLAGAIDKTHMLDPAAASSIERLEQGIFPH
jgi:hypothetical protein